MPDFKIDIPPLQLDTDVELKGGVAVTLLGDPGKPLAAQVQLIGDETRPVSAQVKLLGDPKQPVSAKLDLSMFLANLPILTVADIEHFLKRRIRVPLNFRFGMSAFPLNLFGVDVVQFSLCGEPQVILDDYVPNAYERCAVECEPC